MKKIPIKKSDLIASIRENIPDKIPFDVAVIRPPKALKPRPYMFKEYYSYGYEQIRKMKSVVVIVLFSDVAVDYYIREALIPCLMAQAGRDYGRPIYGYDDYRVLRKEIAVLADMGTIGKNALFFSRKFGFNCKIDCMFSPYEFREYDRQKNSAGNYRLKYCKNCDKCIEQCPVKAYSLFEVTNPDACRVYTDPYYNEKGMQKMCRKCVTACPFSNAILEKLYNNGVPKRKWFFSADYTSG